MSKRTFEQSGQWMSGGRWRSLTLLALTLGLMLLTGASVSGELTPPPAHAASAVAAYDCAANLDLPVVECEALVALYNSTNGPGWTNSTGWLATPHPCAWYGTGCFGGHVTSLYLGYNQLLGGIPLSLGLCLA